MPTYEYACAHCGNAWEEIQKITEPALEVCPACKQATAKRQISGGSFILKGGGWYADLYSSSWAKSKDDSSSKSGEASAKTETKSETGSESKSEPSKSEPSGSGGSGTTGGSSSSKAAAE